MSTESIETVEGDARELSAGEVHALLAAPAASTGSIENALRDLLATIELHTDCMDGRIERAALDPYIERAEELLGQTLEGIIK